MVLASDEEVPVDLLERVDRGNGWVGECGCGPRLAAEAFAAHRVGGRRRGERLERDRPAEAHIIREVDDAHPSASDLPPDEVRSDTRSRLDGGFFVRRLGRWKPAVLTRTRSRGQHRRFIEKAAGPVVRGQQ